MCSSIDRCLVYLPFTDKNAKPKVIYRVVGLGLEATPYLTSGTEQTHSLYN